MAKKQSDQEKESPQSNPVELLTPQQQQEAQGLFGGDWKTKFPAILRFIAGLFEGDLGGIFQGQMPQKSEVQLAAEKGFNKGNG